MSPEKNTTKINQMNLINHHHHHLERWNSFSSVNSRIHRWWIVYCVKWCVCVGWLVGYFCVDLIRFYLFVRFWYDLYIRGWFYTWLILRKFKPMEKKLLLLDVLVFLWKWKWEKKLLENLRFLPEKFFLLLKSFRP